MAGRQAVVLPHWVVAGLTEHVFKPLLDVVRQPDGSLNLPDDPTFRAALEQIDVLRRRPVLGLLTGVCQDSLEWGPMGAPCTTIEHATSSASGAEKVALIDGDPEYYERARIAFRIPGWPIIVLRTMVLSYPEGRTQAGEPIPGGRVLFTGKVGDSYDQHREAIQVALGLSGGQKKRMRPAQDDPAKLLGMPAGTIGPILEPPYWGNIAAIFVVKDAFPMEALSEIPITLRYGLLVWSHALLSFMQSMGEQGRIAGHPPVHLL